jgi:hypothetical protein
MDTKFTKKFGRSRLQVAVLDPSLIPNLVDVVIGDFVYELQFRVEEDMPNGDLEVIDMDSTMEDEDPKDRKPNDEKPNENMNIDGKKDEDQAPNNQSCNQLPDSGKASGGAIHQEDATIGSLVHQSKPIQPS